MHGAEVRRAVFAGSWYPREAQELQSAIGNYLRELPPASPLDGEVVALIAPHAGHAYSGRVAACAYQQVARKNYDSIIIIGPSHRNAFQGVSIMGRGGYETPLGIVRIDEQLATMLSAHSEKVRPFLQAHQQEHAIEIQLPFVQVVLPEHPFVPLIMGDQSRGTCRSLATAIALATADRRVLIIASSDLSHFHSSTKAMQMDNIIRGQLEKMDTEGLLLGLEQGRTEACGGGPMATAIEAAKMRGADGARVLCYANSGDINGDRSRVVGYLAAAFYRKKK